MSKISRCLIPVLILTSAYSALAVKAQNSVQCGDIVESEFRTPDEIHSYEIDLSPGDKLDVSAEPIGDSLSLRVGVSFPSQDNSHWHSDDHQDYQTGVLSEQGTYTIMVLPDTSSTGFYTLYVGCTLSDGTEINPGDTTLGAAPLPTSTAPFSGFGFPGLPPLDFSNIMRLPLPSTGPTNGVITPTGGEILGFTFNANTDDIFDLNYSRLSGNLNLGIIVISENNQVIFQASLIASNSFSTELVLPTSGQYTIGVFRIDLLPPSAPEPTVFQIQGTLNQ